MIVYNHTKRKSEKGFAMASESRVRCEIDFEAAGRQAGYLRAPLSRNTSGWGVVEIPVQRADLGLERIVGEDGARLGLGVCADASRQGIEQQDDAFQRRVRSQAARRGGRIVRRDGGISRGRSRVGHGRGHAARTHVGRRCS